jgi:hypothetical protein
LTEVELSARSHVPDSGWPIGLSEIEPFYPRAERVMGVNSLPFGEDIWPMFGVASPAFDPRWLRARFSKWARTNRRNLAQTLGARLARSGNVDVALHANAVEIELERASNRVGVIRIRNYAGREARIRATHFVLCCGTIEVARLMLASRAMAPAGVGNDHGLVGCYFQDHLSVRAGQIHPANEASFRRMFEPFFQAGTMHSCKLELAPAAQARLKSLSAMGHVVFEPDEDSGFYELRRMIRAVQAGHNMLPTPTRAWRLLRDADDLVRLACAVYLRRRLRAPRRSRCYLHIDIEQAPVSTSRVHLAKRVDPLGVPHALVEWRVNGSEKETVQTYARVIEREWRRAGLGRIEWTPRLFASGDAWLEDARDIYHHAGTTRMSEDPRAGVVDSRLKVHGIANLYVASCAVFPTLGSGNPTLTMMALCARLADHLKAEGRRGQQ